MQISVLPVSFFRDLQAGRMSLAECADLAARSGSQGLDLSPVVLGDMGPDVIRAARLAVQNSGLQIGMLVSYSDFTIPDPAARKKELEKTIRLIGTAAELGAQYVRLTAGQAYPETGRADGITWATEGLLATQEAGSRYGVQLVFENHSKPPVWHYYDFVYPEDIFLEVARQTANSDIGILFDTANPVARGDDPLTLLRQVVSRVRYLHASDTRQAGAGFDPVLLGTGAVPFAALFACLQAHAYDGWIAVEEVSRTGQEGVIRAVAFVRESWLAVKSAAAANNPGTAGRAP